MGEHLRKLIEQARGLFASDIDEAEVKPEHTRSVHADSFDDMDWAMVEAMVPGLQENIADLHEKHDYVPDTFADLFNVLHQGDPLLRESAEMREDHRPNHEIMKQLSSLPEVRELRLSTMHDDYSTAAAMLSMQPVVSDAFERMKEAQDAAKDAAEARARQQEANDALQQMADAAEAGGDGAPTEQELQEALDAAESVGQAAAQAQGQAEAQAEAAGQQMRQQMRDAAAEAANERSEEDELMASFGVDPGELKRMPYQERHDLAKRLRNNRMSKFAKLIGQFRFRADAERRRKVDHKADIVVGVELGDDLVRVTAGELNNLATPETEDQFWLRYANQQLLQYKLAGTEKLGQGPIIVVCDESQSMEEVHQGASREAWSKALSLALCDQARRGRRDFIYIGFSSPSQQWRLDFPNGKGAIADVIQFTEHFFRGGTHYEAPLRMALDIVNDYGDRNKPKPDVVFITDDQCKVSDDFVTQWRAAKDKTDMRCYAIALGDASMGALPKLADDVRGLTDMTNVDQVSDLFRQI